MDPDTYYEECKDLFEITMLKLSKTVTKWVDYITKGNNNLS